METQTLAFTVERETKNTIRYQEKTNGKPPALMLILMREVQFQLTSAGQSSV